LLFLFEEYVLDSDRREHEAASAEVNGRI